MQVIKGLENLKKEKNGTSVAIGVFDGVHAGHQTVINKMIDIAKKEGLKSVVVTFDPNPLDVLRPKKFPTILTALPLKIKLIEELGVDTLVVINFTKEFANINAGNFVKSTLVDTLKMKALVVGERFCLGSKRSGDVSVLFSLSAKYGYSLNVIGKIKDENGNRISSTHIRNLIYEGNLDEATKLLGRYPVFIGKVETGDGRGGLTGFHTANVITQDKASIPKTGVFVGTVITNSSSHPAVINIGASPTFGVKKKRIEAHIIDYDKQLYGKEITISLLKKLREIKKFKDYKELSKQIEKDIEKAKEILRSSNVEARSSNL